MIYRFIQSIFCLCSIILLAGCASAIEKKINENLEQGKAVIIYPTMPLASTWVDLNNPSKKIILNSSDYSVAYVDAGTYVFSHTNWQAHSDHVTYQVIPQFLKSSLGRVEFTNIYRTAKESYVVSEWLPEESYTQLVPTGIAGGGSVPVKTVTRYAGYYNVTKYRNVQKETIDVNNITHYLDQQNKPSFASFEIKAGEIVLLDLYDMDNMKFDTKSCALLENKEPRYSCPLTSIDFIYQPYSQFLRSKGWMKNNLSSKLIEQVKGRSVKLGTLMPSTPVGKSEQGYNIYRIEAK